MHFGQNTILQLEILRTLSEYVLADCHDLTQNDDSLGQVRKITQKAQFMFFLVRLTF